MNRLCSNRARADSLGATRSLSRSNDGWDMVTGSRDRSARCIFHRRSLSRQRASERNATGICRRCDGSARVMSWLASLAIALATAAGGLVLGGYLASLAVGWYRVSSFEGGSGYFVVVFALLGFGVGLVV